VDLQEFPCRKPSVRLPVAYDPSEYTLVSCLDIGFENMSMRGGSVKGVIHVHG
jgi:hypothetical protein